ncbi:hypothetical protein PBY51_016541 [Eleginops maclovinus]|nr:hypothetical protein PBY51_016541 [Eleginops maclovinus]
MSARCAAFLLALTACFLQVLIQGQVFRAPQDVFRAPQDVFLRSRRANRFLVEEILQGDLERECYEELCNYEEAREHFEDTPTTIAFWTVYNDGDQCDPDPCLHGGNCTDRVGGFLCLCPPPHHGLTCELGAPRCPPTAPLVTSPEISECPTGGPAACDQLCTASVGSFVCSCVTGFRLQADGRSCRAEAEFPCGRIPGELNTTAPMCRHGNCPWQASLLDSRGAALCGCAVIGPRSVLTPARCLLTAAARPPRPSDFTVAAGNKELVAVRALYIHGRFREHHRDDDLALLELTSPLNFGPDLTHLCLPPAKDFSENILMHSGRKGVAGAKRLVYKTLDECRRSVNVSHPLSNKMFCMGGQDGAGGGQNQADGRQKGRQDGAGGRQEGFGGRQDGAGGRQDGARGRQEGAGGRQDGAGGRQDGARGRQDGARGRLNQGEGRQNRPKRAQRSLNEHLGSHSGGEGGRDGPDRDHEGQNWHLRNPNSTFRSLDEAFGNQNGARWCGGLLPGTPVATVERGTAFLTGLLMTSSCGGGDGRGGLVFTKLSRYLSWIRPRLKSIEGQITSQVQLYPEQR